MKIKLRQQREDPAKRLFLALSEFTPAKFKVPVRQLRLAKRLRRKPAQ